MITVFGKTEPEMGCVRKIEDLSVTQYAWKECIVNGGLGLVLLAHTEFR